MMFKESEIVYQLREMKPHLLDFFKFEKPNVLVHIACYNSKTNKLTLREPDQNACLAFELQTFMKERKEKMNG